jgi:hypothetical protein
VVVAAASALAAVAAGVLYAQSQHGAGRITAGDV